LSRRVMRGRTCRRALMVGASRPVRPWPGHAVMPAGVPVDAHQALPATVTLPEANRSVVRNQRLHALPSGSAVASAESG
jgi:hypothetical protein